MKKLLIGLLSVVFATTCFGAGIDSDSKLYLPLNSVTNSATTVNGALEVLDAGTGTVITQIGTSTYSTTQTKVWNASGYFDGSAECAWKVTGGFQATFRDSFSISLWVKPDDGQPEALQSFFGGTLGSDDNCSIYLNTNGSIGFTYEANNTNTGFDTDGNFNFDDGATGWTHILWTSDSSTSATGHKIYINGSLVMEATNVGATYSSYDESPYIGIGARWSQSTTDFRQEYTGYIADVRIIPSALANANTLYNADSGTTSAIGTEVLWIKGCQDLSSLGGNTPGIVDFLGNGKLSTAVKKYAGDGTSFLSDGSGDGIQVTDSTGTNFDIFGALDQDWTIEGWIYPTEYLGYNGIVGQIVDANNYWVCLNSNADIYIDFKIGGTRLLNPGTTNDFFYPINEWIHFIMFVHGTGTTNEIACYKNGVQHFYGADADTGTLTAPLYVGYDPATNAPGSSQAGYFSNWRVYNGNPFGCNPNVGVTDDVSANLPTEPYSYEATPPASSSAAQVIIVS